MALVRIGGHVMDTRTVAELMRIIRDIPADKRAKVLDELKKPEYYTEPAKQRA